MTIHKILLLFFLFVLLLGDVLYRDIHLQQSKKHTTLGAQTITTQYGFHFAQQFGTPTSTQITQLNPQWLRFGPVVASKGFSLPSFPSTIHTLILFNNESSFAPTPLHSTDLTVWKNYTDNNYILDLQKFLPTYATISAIEVWNEPDVCVTGYCPYMPPAAYAYMLKRAAQVIKAFNSSIKVIMAGTGTGASNTYLHDVVTADPSAFSQVDGVGLHPYGYSPSGWCITGCSGGTLQSGDLAAKVNSYANMTHLPVWVTEMGYSTTDQQWQAEYMKRAFTILSGLGNVPVVIWFSIHDSSNGNFGLFDAGGNIKPSGIVFSQFTTVQATLSPSVNPSDNNFFVTVCLHGLGNCGDNANPNSGGNTNPQHTTRLAAITILDNQNNPIATASGNILYDAAKQLFTGTIPIGTLPSGQYIATIQSPGYLSKQFSGIISLIDGQPTTLAAVSLVTADINNDNQLDILDYNLLISCFGSKAATSSCQNKSAADLTDDGTINGADYNLFLRELSIQRGI